VRLVCPNGRRGNAADDDYGPGQYAGGAAATRAADSPLAA